MPVDCDTPTACAVPVDVQRLDTIVKRFRAVAISCNSRLLAVVEEERVCRGIADAEQCVTNWHFVDEDSALKESVTRVVRIAEQTFAVPGATLHIPRESVPKIDPSELWSWLAARYDGGQSADVVYHPIARDLAGQFHLLPGGDLRVVGGRPSLRCALWSCKTSCEFGYKSAESLQHILKGFLTIAEWSDFWTDIERGAVLNLIQATRHLRPKPRERIEIGQDILIVPCWSSWEFRLSPRFAERVQLFLSEFKGFQESS